MRSRIGLALVVVLAAPAGAGPASAQSPYGYRDGFRGGPAGLAGRDYSNPGRPNLGYADQFRARPGLVNPPPIDSPLGGGLADPRFATPGVNGRAPFAPYRGYGSGYDRGGAYGGIDRGTGGSRVGAGDRGGYDNRSGVGARGGRAYEGRAYEGRGYDQPRGGQAAPVFTYGSGGYVMQRNAYRPRSSDYVAPPGVTIPNNPRYRVVDPYTGIGYD